MPRSIIDEPLKKMDLMLVRTSTQFQQMRDSLNDPHSVAARQIVMAEYGLASEMAQSLETECGTLLLTFAIRGFSSGSITDEHRGLFREAEAAVQKMTLGALLFRIKKTMPFTLLPWATIDDAKDKRNYLAHHFFRFHNFAVYSESGRSGMVMELVDMRTRFHNARSAVSDAITALEAHCTCGGIDFGGAH